MNSSIPESFLCPITTQVMKYPYTTEQGNTYEYAAVSKWFQTKSTDPMTNVPLRTTKLIPNNILQSQIRQWFEENPKVKFLHNPEATKPPIDTEHETSCSLDKIMVYKGARNRDKIEAKFPIPENFEAFGHYYEFTRQVAKEKRPIILVRCDGGEYQKAPGIAMFTTPKGIIFYNPSDIKETRVLHPQNPCRFGSSCTKTSCPASHRFVCSLGTSCKKQKSCKFLHPESISIVSLGDVYPSNTECKYKVNCTNRDCSFAHTNGRMKIPRENSVELITHSLTLEKLSHPISLSIDMPEEATRYQFQGDFIFFFVPYQGSWAKGHYETVIIHRYNESKKCYSLLGSYSLENHYCNSVVGRGRYFALSFWPYEEEAMRTIWDGVKVIREMQKEQKNIVRQNETLKRNIYMLECQVKEQEKTIEKLRSNVQSLKHERQEKKTAAAVRHREYLERKESQIVAREARREAEKIRRLQQKQERMRNERLRFRDPIHLYVLDGDASGTRQEDWKMVLDYHKGAHNLNLISTSRAMSLEITEHDSIYEFELVAPKNLAALGTLPIQPAALCKQF